MNGKDEQQVQLNTEEMRSFNLMVRTYTCYENDTTVNEHVRAMQVGAIEGVLKRGDSREDKINWQIVQKGGG